jgi:phage terminase large subunit-like protein
MEQAKNYAKGVISGKIDACKYVKQAAQRFLNDLKGAEFVYNEKAAMRALRFVELQKHSKGEWKGRRLILEDWQRFIIANLFGVYRKDGRRKYTRAYLEMPKKQGKSPLAAAIGNYMLLDEADGSPEVYSAATKLDQAAIVWQYAADMFKDFKDEADIDISISSSFNNKRIVYNGGVFRPIAYDERDKNDGLSVSCAIIDEYHAHPSDRIYNVLADGMAARRSPLLLAITTAGHNRDSACYKHREYCEKVLSGVLKDDDLFALIYTIDEGDAWNDEKTHRKANPNYGVSVKPDYIKSKIAEARESGVKKDSFMIKHLNVWTDSYQTWISSTDIERVNQGFEPTKGDSCYVGLDLASSGDFTALALNFLKDGVHRIKFYYYLPEEKVRQWSGGIGEQIRDWVRQGFITMTQGKTTDYEYIERDLLKISEDFNIVSVGFDPYNAKQFAAKMEVHGLNMRDFGQNITNISHPTKMTEELILSDKVIMDGNPVTSWMFSNVVIYTDANLNIKVIKSKDPNKKVDGVVAMIMSIGEGIDENNKVEDWFWNPVSL